MSSLAQQDISRPIADVVDEALEEIEFRHQNPDVGSLKIGLEAFDKHASEALAPGGLVVLASESGSGKTAISIQMAIALGFQIPTLVITLEDGARDTIKRSLANVSRTNVGRIRRGFAGETAIPQGVHDAAEAISTLKIRYVDQVNLAVEDLARVIEMWKRNNGVEHGVVFIDQLSHIVPTDPKHADYFRSRKLPAPPPWNAPETKVLEWQAGFLKLIAEKLGLTIVLVHQLNENHGHQKPTMSSIRGSRGIVHKATLVLIPYCPKVIEVPNPAPGMPKYEQNDLGQAWLIGAKGRTVRTFEERMVWKGDWQAFVDVGQSDVAVYNLPPKRSAKAIEADRKFAELQAKFDRKHQERLLAALQPVQPARELPAAGPVEESEEVPEADWWE